MISDKIDAVESHLDIVEDDVIRCHTLILLNTMSYLDIVEDDVIPWYCWRRCHTPVGSCCRPHRPRPKPARQTRIWDHLWWHINLVLHHKLAPTFAPYDSQIDQRGYKSTNCFKLSYLILSSLLPPTSKIVGSRFGSEKAIRWGPTSVMFGWIMFNDVFPGNYIFD